jgi:GAF domain-containing protein
METVTAIDSVKPKSEVYRQICEALQALLGEETSFVANAANTVALLFHSLQDVNWAGFYMAQGEELVLGPFQGKPACARIPFGKGVCGTAAAEQRTIVVPDVDSFPGHIVCDAASKSEIVVPLLNWGNLVGVLDIDSANPNRFDEEDCEGIESIVSVFLASLATEDLPDLSDSGAEA